jgi:hypothetical protein
MLSTDASQLTWQRATPHWWVLRDWIGPAWQRATANLWVLRDWAIEEESSVYKLYRDAEWISDHSTLADAQAIAKDD